MNRPEFPAPRTPLIPSFLSVLAISLILSSPQARAGKVQTWRQTGSEEFNEGKSRDVVISEAGVIRLGRPLNRDGEGLESDQVWDLARTPDGVIYAATGNQGRVYRRAAGDPRWTLAHDGADSQALSLAVSPSGSVFVGTGPSGQVIELTATEPVTSRPDPSVQYIWDLAFDVKGDLYAATGPEGQLWKRTAGDARWTLLFDSPEVHLLCLALTADGSIAVGSDGKGLIYQIQPDGKASVLYDAPESEIRALLPAADGVLYAATASSGGSSTKTTTLDGRGTSPSWRRVAYQSPSGSSSAKAPKPDDNSIYRIGPDRSVRTLFKTKALFFSLAMSGESLLAGTGPEGVLYELRPSSRETTPLARLESGQVLALLAEPDGALHLGTGDPGQVLTLEGGHRREGTLTSSVLDAKLVSRFGAMGWTGDRPEGTTVALQIRTGNVGEPDATWSDWSAPQHEPDATQADIPPGRFAQYRLSLSTDDPTLTPSLRSVTIRYQTVNLPPEVTKIEVPDLTEADGTKPLTKITLKWTAEDPNDDTLTYRLRVRKQGWPDWVPLGDDSGLDESEYEWDTTSMPPGRYRVRLTASDKPDNPADEALEAHLESDEFVVDHDAPRVTLTPQTSGKLRVDLEDDWTRVVKADYALDGGPWTPLFPADGLLDTPRETAELDPPDLAPGTHILRVRATDAAGNTGAGDILIKRP